MKKAPLYLLFFALITDALDLLNIVGVSTIFGYAITKPLSIAFNLMFFALFTSYKKMSLSEFSLFVIENLPLTENLPIATYLVLSNR